MAQLVTSASPTFQHRITVSDANYTVADTAGVIVSYTSITAARTVQLPAASSSPGQKITIVDESGSCSATNTITILRAGSDAIAGAASYVLNSAYAPVTMVSDGISKWTPTASNGRILGSGASTQVAYFSSPYALTSNPNLVYTAGTKLAIGETTASTSSSTGALTVAGGAGIGGSVYIPVDKFFATDGVLITATTGGSFKIDTTGATASNGNMVVSTKTGGSFFAQVAGVTKFQVGGTAASFATGVPLAVSDTTASTLPTNGAFVLSGGFGCSGDVNILGTASGANLVVGGPATAALRQIIVQTAAGNNRDLQFRTGTTARWTWRCDSTAESGSNAGSNLSLIASDDTGATIDTPLIITRAVGGTFAFARPITTTGNVTSGSNAGTTGVFASNRAVGNNAGLQVQTAGVLRWYVFGSSTAETGSDAGTYFGVAAYTDAGAFIDNPVQINRASGGTITLGGTTNRQVSIPTTTASSSTTTGALVVTGGLGIGGSIYAGSSLNVGSDIILTGNGGSFYTRANSGINSGFQIQKTDGTPRWYIYKTAAAESGSNAGSDLVIGNYNDAGSPLGTGITITRSNGNVSIGGGLTVGGNAAAGASIYANAAAATFRGFQILTAGTQRWNIYADNAAESGGDAGSGLTVRCYTDAGAGIDSPVVINRASGGTITLGGTTARPVILGGSANGAQWIHGSASELLTLSTVGTTTDTSANLLPANAIIEAVVALVTTTITTATDWKLGDPTTAGRFSAAVATMTAGTTTVGTVHADQTGAAGPRQTAAAKVRVTTTGTPGAGAIRITVFYRQFVPPSS